MTDMNHLLQVGGMIVDTRREIKEVITEQHTQIMNAWVHSH